MSAEAAGAPTMAAPDATRTAAAVVTTALANRDIVVRIPFIPLDRADLAWVSLEPGTRRGKSGTGSWDAGTEDPR
jgi:hypothetical protein